MRYCTRANIHVDRCASAWLILRFIDPKAEFVFIDGIDIPSDAIPFDMHGVDWGHKGNRCTFEVLCDLKGLQDPAMRELARIIHGADITADADETLESADVDLLFRGLRCSSETDFETLTKACIVMDALYAALKERTPKSLAKPVFRVLEGGANCS